MRIRFVPTLGRSLAAAVTILAAVAVGCREVAAPQFSTTTQRALLIADGAHGLGNPHFFFLPPLAAEPSGGGALDETLAPEVQVCIWTGPACLYPLTADFPDVTLEGDHYAVNWHSGKTLVAGQTYRIRVLLGAVELGYMDAVAAKNAGDLKDVDASLNFPLVIGRTVPIKFRITVGAVSCDTVQMLAVNDWHMPLQAGYVPPFAAASAGLTFFQGTQVIFGGGPLYGTSPADMLVGYNTGHSLSSFTRWPVCVDRTTPFLHTVAALVPAVSGTGPAGLLATQESFAWPSAPDNGYVLLKYTLTNTGTAPIAGLYSGWVADWDIYYDGNAPPNASTDRVRYDGGLGLGEATEFDTLTYPAILAIVPMGPSGTYSFHGWPNGMDPHSGTNYDVPGPYFPFLAGGIDLAMPQWPSDIREMMGLAPVTLAAGRSTVAFFALVGGANRAAFEANVAAARAMAAALGF